MRLTTRDRIAPFLCLLSIPAVWLGLWFLWLSIDRLIASREVRNYIRDHQQIVTARQTDPKVHRFSLASSGGWGNILDITVDVEDHATYEAVAADLLDLSPQMAQHWHTTIRTGEKLGNDLGMMVQGVTMAHWAISSLMVRLVAITLTTLLLFGFECWYFWLRYPLEP